MDSSPLHMNRIILANLIILLVRSSLATTYYVSPAGSDSNTGTSPETPFLKIEKAVSTAVPGDTILMRGGIYKLSVTVTISKRGTAGRKYYLLAFPGEKPVLDFSSTASGKRGISLTGDHWVFKGLSVMKAGDNGMIISGGSFNLIENCTFSENKDSGLQLGAGAHDNLVINCDSYGNADPPDYADADGFAPKMDVGSNNYFYGCRAWLNCDDGWDGYLRGGNNVTTILENCWTWRNGYLTDGSDPGSQANGNGFKMGGSDDKTLQHHFIIRNCLAFDNKSKGFDQNNNKGSMTIFNGTGFRNKGNDFSIPSTLADGQTATVKNCLLAQGKVSLGSFVIQESNSWNGGFSVSPGDFISLDTTGVSAPRKTDGSLPEISFAHLDPGSRLIDAGIDVGLPYLGLRPDLGCFEYRGPTAISQRNDKNSGHLDIRLSRSGATTIVSFNPSGRSNFSWELWSATGRQVLKSEMEVNGSRGIIALPGNRFSPGIYIFRISSGNKSEAIKIRLH